MLAQLRMYATNLDTFYAMLGSQDADLLERTLTKIQPLIRYQFNEGTGELEYTNKLCRAYLYEMIYNGKVWDGAIGHVADGLGANVPIQLDSLYLMSHRGLYGFWANVSLFSLISQGFWQKIDGFQSLHEVLHIFQHLQEMGELTPEIRPLWSHVPSGRKLTDSKTEINHHNHHDYGYFRNAEIHIIIKLLEPYVLEQKISPLTEFRQLAKQFYDNLQKAAVYDIVFITP
jgi:hypothetical protein